MLRSNQGEFRNCKEKHTGEWLVMRANVVTIAVGLFVGGALLKSLPIFYIVFQTSRLKIA